MTSQRADSAQVALTSWDTNLCPPSLRQLRQSQLELQEVQLSHRQLTSRLQELSEESSLQSATPQRCSLLCEMEQSMEQEEQEQEREQVGSRVKGQGSLICCVSQIAKISEKRFDHIDTSAKRCTVSGDLLTDQ